MQALLFASNPDEIAILRMVLQRIGITVQLTTELEQVNHEWPNHTADVILLAISHRVPLSFIRDFGTNVEVPIVVITDAIAEDVQVAWFDSGVDMVVLRPFSALILMAQIRALMRRTAGVPLFSLPAIARGDIILDPSTRTIRVNQMDPKQLTQLEFRLLYTLMMHADQVMPAETLVEHVWGYSGRGDRNLVRGLVRRLRSKIEPSPGSPRYIVTVPRLGYVFKHQT